MRWVYLAAVQVHGASQAHKIRVGGAVDEQVPADAQVEDDGVHGAQLRPQLQPQAVQPYVVGHCGRRGAV